MKRACFASAVAAAAILLLTLPEAHGIKCYQCNSKKDPGCDDETFTKAGNASTATPAATLATPAAPAAATPARYLSPCQNGPEGEPAFCRKSVITVLAANHGEGETRWVRACGWVKYERECYMMDDGDHIENVCQCFSDACNRAPTAAPARFATASLLLPLLPALTARLR